MTDDFKSDTWIAANSRLGAKRLHALGVISYQWNQSEFWLFELFTNVSGYPRDEAWALVYDLGDVAISLRIKALATRRDLGSKLVALIEDALAAYDICRQNRNSAMHAWTLGIATEGGGALARKSKKIDRPEPEPFPCELEDLRRVAEEIEAISNRLWLLNCLLEEGQQPPPSLGTLLLPSVLWILLPPPSTRPPRQPRSSAALRRSEAMARKQPK